LTLLANHSKLKSSKVRESANILVVSPVYEPFFEKGGMARSVPNLVAALRGIGHKTTVVTPAYQKKPFTPLSFGIIRPVETFWDRLFSRIQRANFIWLSLTITALKLLPKHQVLILNCGFYPANLIIGLWAICKRKRIIFIPRGSGNPERLRHRLIIKRCWVFLENIFLRHSIVIALDGTENVEIYRAKQKTIIPNIFHIDDGVVRLIKNKKDSSIVRISFLGRATEDKGLKKFICLAEVFPHFEFICMTPEATTLKGPSNVRFLVQPTREEVAKYLSICQFNFIWSTGEGLSMALLEGAREGCLPVGRDISVGSIFGKNAIRFKHFEDLLKFFSNNPLDFYDRYAEEVILEASAKCSSTEVEKKLAVYLDGN